MSHECEDCGESFETLSRLRLHECGSDPPAAETPVEDEHAVDVEEEYPDLVGPLPEFVDEARTGDRSALYRAIGEYDTVLSGVPTTDEPDATGPYHDIRWAYYEPLADGLDAAARETGWTC